MNASSDNLTEPDMSGLLLDQLDKLIERELSRDLRESIDQSGDCNSIWLALEDSGFTLALVAEADGGLGMSIDDGMMLARRLAYHAAPVPMGETMIAQHLWTSAGGSLVAGMTPFAPATMADRISGQPDGTKLLLSGQVSRVPWGGRADVVLVLADGTDGNVYVCLVRTDQATIQAGANMAGEPRDTLILDGAVIDAENFREAPAGLTRDSLLQLGARLRTEQMIGAMYACLDHAIPYVNERVQFGRKLAKFQAVQHMLAVAAGEVAAATAAASLATGNDNGLTIAIGKSRASEAATKVSALVHQVFGAMGFTQEHPLHYSTRRLWSWRDEFGSETFWNRRIGAQALENGGEQLWPLIADL